MCGLQMLRGYLLGLPAMRATQTWLNVRILQYVLSKTIGVVDCRNHTAAAKATLSVNGN